MKKHPVTTTPRLLLSAFVLAFAPLLSAAEKTVKVYILAGQSNMVGIGQVAGNDLRWGKEFSDAVLSVYAGTPDAAAEYDKMTEILIAALITGLTNVVTYTMVMYFPEGGEEHHGHGTEAPFFVLAGNNCKLDQMGAIKRFLA